MVEKVHGELAAKGKPGVRNRECEDNSAFVDEDGVGIDEKCYE
jgi:hypothetical protein